MTLGSKDIGNMKIRVRGKYAIPFIVIYIRLAVECYRRILNSIFVI